MSHWGIQKAEPCVDFVIEAEIAELVSCLRLGSNHDKFLLCEVGWCVVSLKQYKWHPSVARQQQSIVQQIILCLKGPECSVYSGCEEKQDEHVLTLHRKTFGTEESTNKRQNGLEDVSNRFTYDVSEVGLFSSPNEQVGGMSYKSIQGSFPHSLEFSRIDNTPGEVRAGLACFCRDPQYWRLGEQLTACAELAVELDELDGDEERRAPDFRAAYGGPMGLLNDDKEMTLPLLFFHHGLRIFAYCQRISDSTTLLGDGFGYCNSGVMVPRPSFESPLKETPLDLPSVSLCCCVRLSKWSGIICRYAKYVIKAQGDAVQLTSCCISRVCVSVGCNVAENLVRAIRIAEYSVVRVLKSLPVITGPDPFLPAVKNDVSLVFAMQCVSGEYDVDTACAPIDHAQPLDRPVTTRALLKEHGSGLDGQQSFLSSNSINLDRTELLQYLFRHLGLRQDDAWNHNVIAHLMSNYTEVLHTLLNLLECIPAAQLLTLTSWNPKVLVHTYLCVLRSLFPFLSELVLSGATSISLCSPQLRTWVSAFSVDVGHLSKAYNVAIRAQNSLWIESSNDTMLQHNFIDNKIPLNNEIRVLLDKPQYTHVLSSVSTLEKVHSTLGDVIDMFLNEPPVLSKLVHTSKSPSIPLAWDHLAEQKKEIQSQTHTCETLYQSWGLQVRQRFSYLFVNLPLHVQQEQHQFETEMTARAHKEIAKADNATQVHQKELRRLTCKPETNVARIDAVKVLIKQNDKSSSLWKEMQMVGPLLWAVLFQYDSQSNALYFSTGYALPNISYFAHRNREFSEHKSLIRDRLRQFDIRQRNISDEANESVEDYIFQCDVIEEDPRKFLSNWSHIGNGAFGAVFAALVANPLPECLPYDSERANVRLNASSSGDTMAFKRAAPIITSSTTPLDCSRKSSCSNGSEDNGVLYDPFAPDNVDIDNDSLSPEPSLLGSLRSDSVSSVGSAKKAENGWDRFVSWIGLNKKPAGAPHNEFVAVKHIDLKTAEGRVACRRETLTLRKCLQHPNIVRYRGTFSHDDSMWIVMSLCDGGTLSGLAKHNAITEPCVAYIAGEVLKALSHLHSVNKIHRDIKPSNILLHVDGSVVLGDLGLAIDFDPFCTRTSIAGTEQYLSPEMIRGTGYDPKTDIWSLGCVLLELCDGPQVEGPSTVACQYALGVCESPTLAQPERWSPQLRDFLALCQEKNPQKRASADQLLQHDFLANALRKSELVALFSHIALDKAQKAVGLV